MPEKDHLQYLYSEEPEINIREEIEKYAQHWKWFALGVIISVMVAYVYIRYTPNQYAVNTTILIDDENSGGLSSGLSDFEELGLLGAGKRNVENEIGLLKSRSLMERVVKDLGINVSYYNKGRVRENEVYKNKVPFKVNFSLKDSLFYKQRTTFSIQALSATHFMLTRADEKRSEHLFGENISTDFGEMTITPADIRNVNTTDELIVKLSPLKKVVGNLKTQISISVLYKKASFIELRLKEPIKQKAQDILNRLVYQYNKDAVADKNLIGNNTNIFIKERLIAIKNDLSHIDKGIEDFKRTNELTDIASESGLILESNSELKNKILELHTQIKLADYVTEYMAQNTEQLIPANLGLTDEGLNANSVRYNQLLLERNRILTSSNLKNPVIINLNAQLEQLEQSIAQGLINLKSSLSITLADAQNQERDLQSRIQTVPKQERLYRDIEREQQIIESLYLYLLQKREENNITLTVAVPNSKVIDTADGSNIPVSPKGKMIYLVAILLGLIIPFTGLYIMYFLDNKVHTSKDIEAEIKAPFLGDIPKNDEEKHIAISSSNLSSIAESFRMLRTNITFMLTASKAASKTIFVTSTIPNEGKTFITINLATSLALLNKKVLVIEADLRKPKLSEYLNVAGTNQGLAHFLMDPDIKPKAVIEHVQETNFDSIHSGVVSLNPSELLMNGRFDELLDFAKAHYDYIIIDTPPASLVSDTLMLSKKADLCLYVIRANVLEKKLLRIPKKLYNEKRLPNMAIVLNDSDIKKSYGYGYGYGNILKKPSWRDKLRRH